VRAQEGKRVVARGSDPSARQAERSGKRRIGGRCPRLPSSSLPAVTSRLQYKSRTQRKAEVWGRKPPPAKRPFARGSEPPARQAERSGKRGFGGGSPHLPSSSLPAVASRLQYKSRTQRKAGVWGRQPHLPSDGAAGLALGRAGAWGQRPQLHSDLGVQTNEHRLFDSVERSTGRAPVNDVAGQAPQNNNAMRLLSRRRRREASHAGGFLSTAA
jgi:hypothetical protein